MGVKVTVNKPELYPLGDYIVAIVGNELDKNKPGKIKVKFVIADGVYAGRPLSRSFNAVISAQSHLGELLIACGVPVQDASSGQQLDLDIINNARVVAALSHYAMQNGSINSLGAFRRYQPGTAVAPAPAVFAPVAPAPVAFAPAAPAAFVPPAPSYAPPAPAFAPAPAPATAFAPAPPAPQASTTPAPALGPKISF